MRQTLTQLWKAKDFEGLVARVKERFEVDFDAIQFCLAINSVCNPMIASDGCDDIITVWLKKRLTEIGAFHCGRCSEVNAVMTVTLHVGFVHLEETDEMLARLGNERARAAVLASTSKIFSTPLIPRPIDSIAATGMKT